MTAEPLTGAATPAPPPPAAPVRAGVASGLRWGALNQAVQQGVRLAVQVVLTRLLAPEAFGLLALAFVVVNLGAQLTGLGFSQALIQRPQVDRRLIDATFVGSALVGAAIAAVVLLAAAPIAVLLGDADVAPVLRALSAVFLLQGVEGVPNSLLRRRLLFRPFVLSSTIAAVAGGAVGIGMGLAGAGVWALVGFALAEAFVATSLAWTFAMRAGVWRPHLTGDLRPLRDVLGYSGAVTTNRLLFYTSRNLDNVIVGRVLGAAALGVYGLAYRVMLFPIQRVTEVVGGVALPAFATLQGEPERVRTGYLRAVRGLATLLVPLTVGVAVTAPHLVPTVFGPQWTEAITPVRVLALSGPALALVRLSGILWEATGRATLSLVTSSAAIALLIPAFLVGVRFGVIGVAVAYTATTYLGVAPVLVVLKRTVGVGVGAQLRTLAPVLAATAVMAGATIGLDVALGDVLPDAGVLATQVVAGIVTYVGALLLLDRDVLRDSATLLLRRGRGRGR